MTNKSSFAFGALFGGIAVSVVTAVMPAVLSGLSTPASWPDPMDIRRELGHADAPAPRELVITSARYGANDSWVDVAARLREQVADSRLSIHVGNDLAPDPAFGKMKRLEVEYVMDGRTESLSFPEGGFLEIPGLGAIDNAEDLLALVARCPAEVGFHGINLGTGQAVSYRPDQAACMASIVKLFALLEVSSQIRAGRLKPTDEVRVEGRTKTIADALDLMIGQSDNAATGALAARVGYDKVNALPRELAMTGVSAQIMPKPGVLDRILDRRLEGPRLAPSDDLLPQHATARGMVRFFELLHKGELRSPEISADVRAVLERHPRGFVPHAPTGFVVMGKGGSLAWGRFLKPGYNMIGWNLYVTDGRTSVAFCLWCEWFPEKMPRELIDKWCFEISDGIVGVLCKAGGPT